MQNLISDEYDFLELMNLNQYFEYRELHFYSALGISMVLLYSLTTIIYLLLLIY